MFSRWILGPCLLLVVAASAAALVFLMRPAGAAAPILVTRFDDPPPDTCIVGDCSLREAIIGANNAPGADTIILPGGAPYNLTIGGGGEDASATGDLDITDDLTIDGGASGTTTIDAGDLDRVLEVRSGTADITGVILQNGSSGSSGGGVSISQGAALSLTNSTVRDNYAFLVAGIYNGGTLTLTNSTVSGNTTPNETGGLINNLGATATITNSTISGNSAGFGPGGIYNFNLSTTNIVDSTISGNTTGGSGGAIVNGSGSLTMTNSTISGNTAKSHGGGIYTEAAISLLNVTIANNTADSDANGSGDGGGIYVPWWASAGLKNTIIAGNSDLSSGTVEPDCHAVPDSGGLVSGGNILVEDTTGCTITGDTTNNVTGQPANLGPLANNGGGTLTHALLAGSPAIDFASGDCPPPAADQRGVARPQGNRCDIGAYESSFSGPTPVTTPSPVPSQTPTPTPTTGPSPSVTATGTPTATPTPTPTSTGTPGTLPSVTPTGTPAEALWGDVDCNGEVDSVDSLKVLRYVAGLPVSQDEPCTDIGEEFASIMGDVDCDLEVSSVDALKVLRFVASLPVAQDEPCPDIGTQV